MASIHPPGPRGLPVLGSALDFMGDAVAFIDRVAQHGELAHFRMGPVHAYLLSRADYVYEVLVRQASVFHKDEITKRVGGKFVGNGLVLADDSFHRQQRKLIQPAFHHKRIEGYAQTMVDCVKKMLSRWRVNDRVNVEDEMLSLTLGIVSKALLSADVEDETNSVAEAMAIFQKTVGLELRGAFVLPDWLPISHKREMKRAIRTLNAVIHKIIAEHRQSGQDKGDLLSMLMTASTDEGGRMSDGQLRDEVMTIFMAGHETTASLLTWVLCMVSQHPQVMARLRQEVDEVITGDAVELSGLRNLTYTDMVLKETARLYPPFWLTSRTPIEDVSLGGYTIPRGSMVFICPYLLQRNAQYFREPDRFLPERFAGDGEKQIPHCAYLPFGAGSRICVGQQFGMMEAKIALAMIVKEYSFQLASQKNVEVLGRVTLRPREPVYMKVTKREQPTPAQ
jgi:cytochrome P450